MQSALRITSQAHYPVLSVEPMETDFLQCDWKSLKEQILMQWSRISQADIDKAGPSRHHLAALVQRKYGIDCRLVENYLRNLERTLPAV